MTNSQLFKLTSAWISIVYAVCFLGVALVPDLRPLFMEYALHTGGTVGTNVMTFTTFVSGLIIWNVIALLAVWLYAALRRYYVR